MRLEGTLCWTWRDVVRRDALFKCLFWPERVVVYVYLAMSVGKLWKPGIEEEGNGRIRVDIPAQLASYFQKKRKEVHSNKWEKCNSQKRALLAKVINLVERRTNLRLLRRWSFFPHFVNWPRLETGAGRVANSAGALFIFSNFFLRCSRISRRWKQCQCVDGAPK